MGTFYYLASLRFIKPRKLDLHRQAIRLLSYYSLRVVHFDAELDSSTVI